MATARTAADLCRAALLKLGVIDSAISTPAQDAADALAGLQDLLAELSMDGLTIPFATWQSKTLTPATLDYTIGETSADWDTVRPTNIQAAFIRDSGNADHPIEIIQEPDYQAIRSKTASGRPDKLWYNPTVPNGTIYLYPSPNAAEDLYILHEAPFTEPDGTDDMMADALIPREYYNPLKWLLAFEIAPDYGIANPSPVIISRATAGKSKIVSLNMARKIQAASFEIPTATRRSYSIFTG